MRQGDVKIGGFFWVDGQRYKRIGETSILPVDSDGEMLGSALTLFPFDYVDLIE